MIEIERKFILADDDKERIIKNAEFLHERTFVDTYYDKSDFVLTSQDKWLRCRNGKFELKAPLRQRTRGFADQYREVENEQEIKKILNLPLNSSLNRSLKKNGYVPFCVCTTTREKYRNAQFTIDFDTANFECFTYTLAEIEVMVQDEKEIGNAIKQIVNFARKQNLILAPTRGKIIEYLKNFKPKHYLTLVQAGIVND